MAPKNTSGRGRTRNFATVVYPESAPENWQDILIEQFVPAFISPLHDSDVNPNGEPKKPHYHIMIMFEGVKTKDQAKAIFDLIGGVGCEPINSVRGYARYLCHLDNPEKHQYNTQDVRALAGADYLSTIGSASSRHGAIREMIYFCRDNNVYSYSDLLEYCAEHREDWFKVLCDGGTMVIKEYLRSKSWTINAQAKMVGKTFIAENNLESK